MLSHLKDWAYKPVTDSLQWSLALKARIHDLMLSTKGGGTLLQT